MFAKYIGWNIVNIQVLWKPGSTSLDPDLYDEGNNFDFQLMTGLRGVIPLHYGEKIGSVALYADGRVGAGFAVGGGGSGSGMCFDLEFGVELASIICIGLAYNHQGGNFKGEAMGYSFETELDQNFIGLRLGIHL
jgi:hypothetical protein